MIDLGSALEGCESGVGYARGMETSGPAARDIMCTRIVVMET